ncbi:MAG: efflux RND transporter permease subunit, partial [Gammaproteobacteria bacterium]
MNRPALADMFYRNPRLTILAVGFILVAGLAALQTLARQEDPTMTRRFAQVETTLPGATAARVEALVTEKLEGRLREIAEIRELRSLSRAGRSIIIVQLSDKVGPDTADIVWSEVRDKLAEAEPDLPAAAGRPTLEVREPIASTLVIAFTWQGAGEPQVSMLARLARDLETRLANVPGTRETTLYGEVLEEVRVSVDAMALAAADLSAERLADRIAAADTRSPAGRLQGRDSELLVEVMGELD